MYFDFLATIIFFIIIKHITPVGKYKVGTHAI
jgi:hypothetical protein